MRANTTFARKMVPAAKAWSVMLQTTLPVLDCHHSLAIEPPRERSGINIERESTAVVVSEAGFAISNCGFIRGRESSGRLCIPHSDRVSRESCVLHFGNHQRVPPQLVLEPAKHGPRQRAEIPYALVFVLNVLLYDVGEDVLFLN